jgi:hypothetical protein
MTGSVAIKSTTFIRSWFLPLLPTIPIKVETTSAVNASFTCIGCLHTVLWEIENSISSGFVTIDFGYSFIRSFKPHHIRPSLISSACSGQLMTLTEVSSYCSPEELPLVKPWIFFRFRVDSSVDSSRTTMFFRGKGWHHVYVDVDTGYASGSFLVSIIDENQLGYVFCYLSFALHVMSTGNRSDESSFSLIFLYLHAWIPWISISFITWIGLVSKLDLTRRSLV